MCAVVPEKKVGRVGQIQLLFPEPILARELTTLVSHGRRPQDPQRQCSSAISGIPVRNAV